MKIVGEVGELGGWCGVRGRVTFGLLRAVAVEGYCVD